MHASFQLQAVPRTFEDRHRESGNLRHFRSLLSAAFLKHCATIKNILKKYFEETLVEYTKIK